MTQYALPVKHRQVHVARSFTVLFSCALLLVALGCHNADQDKDLKTGAANQQFTGISPQDYARLMKRGREIEKQKLLTATEEDVDYVMQLAYRGDSLNRSITGPGYLTATMPLMVSKNYPASRSEKIFKFASDLLSFKADNPLEVHSANLVALSLFVRLENSGVPPSRIRALLRPFAQTLNDTNDPRRECRSILLKVFNISS